MRRQVWYFIVTESIIDIGKVTIGQIIGLIHQEEISEQGSVRGQSDECLFFIAGFQAGPQKCTDDHLGTGADSAPAFFILHRVIPVSSDLGYTGEKGNPLHRAIPAAES